MVQLIFGKGFLGTRAALCGPVARPDPYFQGAPGPRLVAAGRPARSRPLRDPNRGGGSQYLGAGRRHDPLVH